MSEKESKIRPEPFFQLRDYLFVANEIYAKIEVLKYMCEKDGMHYLMPNLDIKKQGIKTEIDAIINEWIRKYRPVR
jgi:hypothetical protein